MRMSRKSKICQHDQSKVESWTHTAVTGKGEQSLKVMATVRKYNRPTIQTSSDKCLLKKRETDFHGIS